MDIAKLADAIAFMGIGVLMIAFRQQFVEWVANRNARFGMYHRHDRAARFTAWFIGVTMFLVGVVELTIWLRL